MSGFKPYPEYKDSGLEWLGEVPAHWDAVPLKHLVSINDETLPEDTDPEHEIVYVDIGGVTFTDGISTRQPLIFSNAPSRARRITREGDTIVSTVRTYLRAVASIKKADDGVVVSTGFAVLRPRALLPEYLGYLCKDSHIIEQIVARSVGVSYPAINASDIGEISGLIPTSSEQSQIARFLDHETAKIDALIAEQQRLIELLQEKRQAVISHAVTKGLNPDAPMKDSGVEWLGDVPAHWEVGSLRWYATIQGGIAKGKDNQGLATVEMPYLRVANVQDGYVDLSEVKSIDVLPSEVERYLLQTGDVLMNEGGDNDKLGRGCVWSGEIDPCLHQNHVFAIRTKSSISPEWLAIFTQGSAARAYFQTSAKQSTNLASISASNIMGLPIAIPPPSEQTAILSQLESINSRIDVLSSSARSASQFLQERRSALISAAVTGKIDVRDWQPPEGDSVELTVDTEAA